jgi:hypothetical protein
VHKPRILTGDAISSEDVIGCDFFSNSTLIVDRVGGKLSFVKNNNKKETK